MSQLVTFQLTDAEQKFLLDIARSAVHSYLLREMPALPDVAEGVLTEPRAIFVSIHQDGALRGCMGNIHPAGPLYRSAAECAISAAVADPRFMPLIAVELSTVDFEISVLSPMQRIEDIRRIEVGKHGLLISKNGASGLLLPQVASTYAWTREQFLQETCKKAGLRPDDWMDDATIEVFSALVFAERRPRPHDG